MLNSIITDWNSLYKDHPAHHCVGSIPIREESATARLKCLEVRIDQAITLPTSELSSFTFWGALDKKNCDAAFLIDLGEGKLEMILVEMKSSFDTNTLFEAKTQIVSSCTKLYILVNALACSSKYSITRSYGIIVSLSPDLDKLNWIQKMSALPRERWGSSCCGLSLYLDRRIKVDTSVFPQNLLHCPSSFEIYYYDSPTSCLSIQLPR